MLGRFAMRAIASVLKSPYNADICSRFIPVKTGTGRWKTMLPLDKELIDEFGRAIEYHDMH